MLLVLQSDELGNMRVCQRMMLSKAFEGRSASLLGFLVDAHSKQPAWSVLIPVLCSQSFSLSYACLEGFLHPATLALLLACGVVWRQETRLKTLVLTLAHQLRIHILWTITFSTQLAQHVLCVKADKLGMAGEVWCSRRPRLVKATRRFSISTHTCP